MVFFVINLMVLPEKTKWESLVEWAYKHNFLVNTINRRLFKARVSKSDIPVSWKGDDALKIVSIGQSHIDAAWLWRKEDTKTKKINYTFDRALMHMKMYEDRDFTYTQNQVVYYDWVKKFYPELWEGIQRRFSEGRWEVVDGAWVESDVNIPSAESLIHQRLIGQYWYLENFGIMSDIAWCDDVFGFPFQLPQILAKCNAKYFLTNKFCYNDTNIWPYHSMIWRGPDGKSDLLFAWNQHKNNWQKYLKTWRERSVLVDDGEEVILNYMSDFEGAKSKFKDECLLLTPNVYGHGDGGHGPKPLEIVEQLCWEDDGFSKLGTMRFFFDQLEQYRENLPIWQDELYLENHRGTLTTIHMIKENNKTSEVLLHDIEYLNVFNVLLGGENYQDQITELWKPVLFGQFHDVLPGSSIPEVYRDCANDYEQVYSGLFQLYNKISKEILQSSETADLTVINTYSWPKTGVITLRMDEILQKLRIEDEDIEHAVRPNLKITDSSGFTYDWQILSFPHFDPNREFITGRMPVTGKDYQKNTDGSVVLEEFNNSNKPLEDQYLWIFVPPEKSLDGFETRLLNIEITDVPDQSPGLIVAQTEYETENDKIIALNNGVLDVRIDAENGKIISVHDDNNKELIENIGLMLYEDPKTHFDAWNIHPEYRNNPVDLPKIEQYEIHQEDGFAKSVLLKTEKSEAGSSYYYRIYLLSDIKSIFYEITVDWQEDHKLLKFSVKPNFESEKVRNGMQYGSIERITVPKNRFNNYRAKYEYPNQQWSSTVGEIDGERYEVVLLNRNKYGIFAHGSQMELSLLKAANFHNPKKVATLDADDPRPEITDLGFNRLSVAVKFNSDPQDNYDYRSGYDFNSPLLTMQGKCAEGFKNILSGFLSIDGDSDNLIIGACKMRQSIPRGKNENKEWFLDCEDGMVWIIIRLAEFYGLESNVKLNIHKRFGVIDAVETDMLERRLDHLSENSHSDNVYRRKIDIERAENSIQFSVDPNEILTIAVKLQKSP